MLAVMMLLQLTAAPFAPHTTRAADVQIVVISGLVEQEIAGVYINWVPGLPPVIAIDETYSDNFHVMGHETGHALWDLDLTESQKRLWAWIHERETQKPPERRAAAVRLYSDSAHSFAEAYGHYVTAPEKLSGHMRRFMDSVVRSSHHCKAAVHPPAKAFLQRLAAHRLPSDSEPDPDLLTVLASFRVIPAAPATPDRRVPKD